MQTLKSRESRKSHKPENVKNKWYKQRWWGDVRKHAASHKKGKHATGTWNSSYWQANDTYYEDPGEDNGWTWKMNFGVLWAMMALTNAFFATEKLRAKKLSLTVWVTSTSSCWSCWWTAGNGVHTPAQHFIMNMGHGSWRRGSILKCPSIFLALEGLLLVFAQACEDSEQVPSWSWGSIEDGIKALLSQHANDAVQFFGAQAKDQSDHLRQITSNKAWKANWIRRMADALATFRCQWESSKVAILSKLFLMEWDSPMPPSERCVFQRYIYILILIGPLAPSVPAMIATCSWTMNFLLRIFFSACRVWTLRVFETDFGYSWSLFTLLQERACLPGQAMFLARSLEEGLLLGHRKPKLQHQYFCSCRTFCWLQVDAALVDAASRSVRAARELKRSSPRLPHLLAGFEKPGRRWRGEEAASPSHPLPARALGQKFRKSVLGTKQMSVFRTWIRTRASSLICGSDSWLTRKRTVGWTTASLQSADLEAQWRYRS